SVKSWFSAIGPKVRMSRVSERTCARSAVYSPGGADGTTIEANAGARPCTSTVTTTLRASVEIPRASGTGASHGVRIRATRGSRRSGASARCTASTKRGSSARRVALLKISPNDGDRGASSASSSRTALLEPVAQGLGHQPVGRLAERLSVQLERPPVHRHEQGRGEVLERLDGFLGAQMVGMVVAEIAVAADRQRGEVERAIASRDV